MSGETKLATALELALIEALSDANCVVRSLNLAAKEAEQDGNTTLAARLSKASTELGSAAVDEVIDVLNVTLNMSSDRMWALGSDPDGAITRELQLARAAARALEVHLERVNGFGRERDDAAERAAQDAADAAEKEAEKARVQASVDKALAAAKEATAKKEAAAQAAAPAKSAAAAAPAKAAPKVEAKAETVKPAPPAKTATVPAAAKPAAPKK